MLAVVLCVFSYFHRNLPSLADTPTRKFFSQLTYCRTPPPWAGMTEAYPAPPPPGTAAFQRTAPVFLSSAARAAASAPGVQITRSPSTNGDSLKPQPDIILPPKSLP